MEHRGRRIPPLIHWLSQVLLKTCLRALARTLPQPVSTTPHLVISAWRFPCPPPKVSMTSHRSASRMPPLETAGLLLRFRSALMADLLFRILAPEQQTFSCHSHQQAL